MLVIKDLTKKFDNNTILDDITMKFKRGKIYAVVGKNGVGKTTLLNCISGNTNYTGSITLDNKEVKSSYVTSPPMVPLYLTPEEIINYVFGTTNLLNELDIKEEDHNKVLKDCSLGTKYKVLFAIATNSTDDVILFDEPFVNFDNNFKKYAMTKIKNIKNKIIIIATHDYNLVKDLCDEVYIIDSKKVKKINKKDLA